MFYVVDIFTKVKKLHNFSLKGKFIFSPTKQASSLNLSRGLTGFTALEGYFDDVGSILEVWNDKLLLVKWDAYTLFLMSRNRGNRFGRSERGIGSSREVKTDFRAYALFPTMQIASLGKARRQGGSSITFVQVSVLGEGYRYPSSPLGLEYRYWLLSTDTSCLKTVFGTP
ncbi:hypothetical protein GQ457_02G030450 [Hibiscus cannabinus]